MKKSLTVNSLFNVLYKIVNALYPLVAVTYVSHVLQAEKMGMVSYAQNIVSYFAVLAALGLSAYGTREIAKVSESNEKRDHVFWELFLINFVSTLVALLIYIFLILNVSKFRDNLTLYLVAGLQIVLNIINVDWFYQGIEEYKYISIRSVLVKICALILLPLLVRNQKDYINYALLYCLAIAGNNVFNVLRLKKYIRPRKFKLNLSRHLKPVSILLVTSLAVEVYVMIDTTMLGFFCSNEVVGCYSNAMKLTRCVNTTAAAIGGVLFPRLSIMYDQKDIKNFNRIVNMCIRIMLTIAIPASLGLIILSRECILVLFGESFIQSVPILRILSLMIPVVICNTLLGAQVLVTTNLENKYVITVVISAIVNVSLNAMLIPKFGATSAAVASLLSEIIVLILYIYFSRKVLTLKIEMHFWVTIFVPLFLYCVSSFLVKYIFDFGAIATIVFNVFLCGIIYFPIGLLLKNDAMGFCYEKLKYIVLKRLKR